MSLPQLMSTSDPEESLGRPNSLDIISLSSSLSSQSSVCSRQASVCSQNQIGSDDGTGDVTVPQQNCDDGSPDGLPTPVEICMFQSEGQITSKNISSQLCQLMGEAAIKEDEYQGFEVIGKVQEGLSSSTSPVQAVNIVYSPMKGSPGSNRPVLINAGIPTPDDAVTFSVWVRSISRDGPKFSKPGKEVPTPGSASNSIIDNVWAMYADKGKLYLFNCKNPKGKTQQIPVKGIKLKSVRLGSDRTIAKFSPTMTPDLQVVSTSIGEDMEKRLVRLDPAQGPNPDETSSAHLSLPPTVEAPDGTMRISEITVNRDVCLITSDAGGFLVLELNDSGGPQLLAMDEAKLTEKLEAQSQATSYPSEAGFTPLVNVRIASEAGIDCNMAIFFNTLKHRYYIHVDPDGSLKIHPVPWERISDSGEWKKHLFFSHSEHHTGRDFSDAPSDKQNVESPSPSTLSSPQKLEFESSKTPTSLSPADSNFGSSEEEPALIPYEDTLEGRHKSATPPFNVEDSSPSRHEERLSSVDSGMGVDEHAGGGATVGRTDVDDRNSKSVGLKTKDKMLQCA